MTGEDLKAWMAEHHYDVPWLAYDLGVHWTMLYRWLSGDAEISLLVPIALQRLAEDGRRSAVRERLRMTSADLRAWMAEHHYSEEDLAIALDLRPRALVALMAAEELPREIVWALRGLERTVWPGPAGAEMSAEEFTAEMARRGLSVQDVCDGLGVTKGAVSRWMNGSRSVAPLTALAFAQLGRKRR